MPITQPGGGGLGTRGMPLKAYYNRGQAGCGYPFMGAAPPGAGMPAKPCSSPSCGSPPLEPGAPARPGGIYPPRGNWKVGTGPWGRIGRLAPRLA